MSASASTAAGRRRAAATRGAGTKPRTPPAARSGAGKSRAATPRRSAASTPARRPASPRAPARRAPARRRRPATRPGPLSRLAGLRPSLPRHSLRLGSISVRGPALSGVRGIAGRRRLMISALLAAAAAAAYFGWFQNSSLVAVSHVSVQGATASDRAAVVGALTDAAQGTSTLNVDQARLDAAAARFPTVASISVHPHFPSGMTIDVTERPPALIASDGKAQTPVAADGTILTGLDVGGRAADLPVLHVRALPTGGRLGGTPLQKALVLGAAPASLRPLIDHVTIVSGTGIVATLQGGFRIEFGAAADAVAKWAAAATVLADPKLHSLAYVDVRIPGRPAVGGS